MRDMCRPGLHLGLALPQLDPANQHRLYSFVQESCCGCDSCLQGVWVAGLWNQVERHRLLTEGWMVHSCKGSSKSARAILMHVNMLRTMTAHSRRIV